MRPTDVGKRKSFDKGIDQLTREGTVQILRRCDDPGARPIVAAVGRLQLDVLEYRLRDEYGVACAIELLPFQCSAWLRKDVETFKKPYSALLTRDGAGRAVVLFPTATFTLTEPIELGTEPADGVEVTTAVTGELTLRGVTNPVTFDVTAKQENGLIGVQGSIPVLFSDYAIANPSNGGITTEDNGLVEFVLVFEPA